MTEIHNLTYLNWNIMEMPLLYNDVELIAAENTVFT